MFLVILTDYNSCYPVKKANLNIIIHFSNVFCYSRGKILVFMSQKKNEILNQTYVWNNESGILAYVQKHDKITLPIDSTSSRRKELQWREEYLPLCWILFLRPLFITLASPLISSVMVATACDNCPIKSWAMGAII